MSLHLFRTRFQAAYLRWAALMFRARPRYPNMLGQLPICMAYEESLLLSAGFPASHAGQVATAAAWQFAPASPSQSTTATAKELGCHLRCCKLCVKFFLWPTNLHVLSHMHIVHSHLPRVLCNRAYWRPEPLFS